MKKTLLLITLLSTLLLADTSVNFRVGGMTCGGCASGINESFKEDFAGYSVHVDYDTAIMSVSTKDGSDVDVKKFQDALDEMGFKGTLVK